MDSVPELFEELQAEIGSSETFRVARCFMMRYMELAQLKAPLVVIDALSIGNAYQLGKATPEQLEQARLCCWAYIDERTNSADLSKPDVCAVRAAICFLHPEPKSDDVFELVSWYLILMEKTGLCLPNPASVLNDCLL